MPPYSATVTSRTSSTAAAENDEAGQWLLFGAAAMLLVAGGCGCGYRATSAASTTDWRVCDGAGCEDGRVFYQVDAATYCARLPGDGAPVACGQTVRVRYPADRPSRGRVLSGSEEGGGSGAPWSALMWVLLFGVLAMGSMAASTTTDRRARHTH